MLRCAMIGVLVGLAWVLAGTAPPAAPAAFTATVGPIARVPVTMSPSLLRTSASAVDGSRIIVCAEGEETTGPTIEYTGARPWHRRTFAICWTTDAGRTWRTALRDTASWWMSENSCAFGIGGTAYAAVSASNVHDGRTDHEAGVLHLWRSSDGGDIGGQSVGCSLRRLVDARGRHDARAASRESLPVRQRRGRGPTRTAAGSGSVGPDGHVGPRRGRVPAADVAKRRRGFRNEGLRRVRHLGDALDAPSAEGALGRRRLSVGGPGAPRRHRERHLHGQPREDRRASVARTRSRHRSGAPDRHGARGVARRRPDGRHGAAHSGAARRTRLRRWEHDWLRRRRAGPGRGQLARRGLRRHCR